MKKLFYLFAVAVVAISLASCNKKDDVDPSKQTVKIEATNLDFSEQSYYGMFTFGLVQASTDAWAIEGYLMPAADDYYTTYSSAAEDIYLYAYDEEDNGFELTVSSAKLAKDGKTTTFTAAATDTLGRAFDIKATYVTPDKPATAIEHAFASKAEVMYYPSTKDYYIFVEDDKYVLSVDIYTETLAGTYSSDDEDFYMDYTLMGIIENRDTTVLAAYSVEAKVTATATGNDFEVEFFAKDGNLYKFTFSYDKPVAEKTENVSLTNGVWQDLGEYASYYGISHHFSAANADSSLVMAFGVIPSDLSKALTEKDLEPYYSAVWVNGKAHGMVEVSLNVAVNGKNATLTGSALCDNNVQYDFTIAAAQAEQATAPARKLAKKAIVGHKAVPAKVAALKK